MRKIKKFKIPVYSYDILRKARKAEIDLDSTGLGAEQDFKEYVSLLASTLEPSVVFDYFTPDDKDISVLGSPQQNPLTIGMLTLGKNFAEKIKLEPENLRKQINEIAVSVFMSAAVKIMVDLARQEAEPEGFQINSPFFIYSNPDLGNSNTEKEIPLYRNELLQKLYSRLEAEKIGIDLNNGKILPEYSCVFSCEWITKQKKK